MSPASANGNVSPKIRICFYNRKIYSTFFFFFQVMFSQRPGQPGAASTNPAAPSTGLTDSLPASALATVVSLASGNPNAGMAVVQEAQAQAWQQYNDQAWAQYAAWNQYNEVGALKCKIYFFISVTSYELCSMNSSLGNTIHSCPPYILSYNLLF